MAHGFLWFSLAVYLTLSSLLLPLFGPVCEDVDYAVITGIHIGKMSNTQADRQELMTLQSLSVGSASGSAATLIHHTKKIVVK